MSLLCLAHHAVRLWSSPRRWPRGATNILQIRWKCAHFLLSIQGRWPSLIRQIRYGSLVSCIHLSQYPSTIALWHFATRLCKWFGMGLCAHHFVKPLTQAALLFMVLFRKELFKCLRKILVNQRLTWGFMNPLHDTSKAEFKQNLLRGNLLRKNRSIWPRKTAWVLLPSWDPRFSLERLEIVTNFSLPYVAHIYVEEAKRNEDGSRERSKSLGNLKNCHDLLGQMTHLSRNL